MPEFTEKCITCEYLGEGDKDRAICTADNCTEIDVSPPDKADLQQFTPEQIEDCCENLEGMSIVLRDAVQIIRKMALAGEKANHEGKEEKENSRQAKACV